MPVFGWRDETGADVPELVWADEAIRGAFALLAFLGIFAAARFRFSPQEAQDGPTDTGLD